MLCNVNHRPYVSPSFNIIIIIIIILSNEALFSYFIDLNCFIRSVHENDSEQNWPSAGKIKAARSIKKNNTCMDEISNDYSVTTPSTTLIVLSLHSEPDFSSAATIHHKIITIG